MADDNLLLGLTGFMEGLEAGFVPLVQLHEKVGLEQRLKGYESQQTLEREKQLEKYKAGLKSTETGDMTPLTITPGWAIATGLKEGSQSTLGEAKALASQRGKQFSPYADVRAAQNIESDLPSKEGNRTPAGQASMMQLFARRGKAMISKKGSPADIALASADLARMISGGVPQLELLRGADYAKNINTEFSSLGQRLLADPNGVDAPKIRKKVYDTLDQIEKEGKPFIERGLKNVEDIWGGQGRLPKNWKAIKAREMGEDLTDTPFEGGSISFSPSTPLQVGRTPEQEKRYQELKSRK